MLIYVIFISAIVVLWIIDGKYEWKVPKSFVKKIKTLAEGKENPITDAFVLNIEAREFIHDDIEKEIYIIRKSRKNSAESIIMNVETEDTVAEQEKEKAKRRLERRFPGLVVNYKKKAQVEGDAFLSTD